MKLIVSFVFAALSLTSCATEEAMGLDVGSCYSPQPICISGRPVCMCDAVRNCYWVCR